MSFAFFTLAVDRLRFRLRVMLRPFAVWRQNVVDRVLSSLYEAPMRLLPADHIAVGGAVVLWFMKDGQRHVVATRPHGATCFATLPHCRGLHRRTHTVAETLRDTLWATLGKAFCDTLPLHKIASNTLVATVSTYTPEANGIRTYLQTSVWAVAIQPIQLELLKAPAGIDVISLPERVFLEDTPTLEVDRQTLEIYRAALSHLPRKRLGKPTHEVEPDADDLPPEDTPPRSPRTLH